MINSRIIMDASIPVEWGDRKPIEIMLDEPMAEKVKARWKEYGID